MFQAESTYKKIRLYEIRQAPQVLERPRPLTQRYRLSERAHQKDTPWEATRSIPVALSGRPAGQAFRRSGASSCAMGAQRASRSIAAAQPALPGIYQTSYVLPSHSHPPLGVAQAIQMERSYCRAATRKQTLQVRDGQLLMKQPNARVESLVLISAWRAHP